MDSCAYQDAIYHPYADMKKSSDALFVVLIGPWKQTSPSWSQEIAGGGVSDAWLQS
jgi:hypothetical protein